MASENALAMLAWARLWSPLGDDAAREDAWAALGLPGRFADARVDYWSLCHGPEAPVPLLLHAGIGIDGAAAREALLRVMDHLGLGWSEHQLPPDQLGVVCEVLACAIEAEEPVLVRELRARYLLPWCEAVSTRLARGSPLAELVAEFRADLARLDCGGDPGQASMMQAFQREDPRP